MKSSKIWLGAIVALGYVQAAQAGSLQFAFDVGFTQGPLLGMTTRGTFAIECTAPCNGTFTPTDAGARLLSFDVAVDGLGFAMSDDVNYLTGSYPYVTVVDGAVSVFDFSGQKDLANGARRLDLSYGLGGGSALFFDPDFFASVDPSFGSIGAVAAVPEPGSAALLALGLACLASKGMRRRASSSPV
jgi:hypothetical protein